MDNISLMHIFTNLIPSIANLQDVPLDKIASIGASMIFIGVFVLQFFSIYRHSGRDAVAGIKLELAARTRNTGMRWPWSGSAGSGGKPLTSDTISRSSFERTAEAKVD